MHFGILRQPNPPQELATTTLYPMPYIVLVFLLYIPLSLSANLKHPVIFNFDLHFLLFKSWKICLEDMGFWYLIPIKPGVNRG